MITIGMDYSVREGKEEVFESAFSRILTAVGKMPGHEETRLYRRVEAPHEYLILSRWEDERAFDAFIRSEQFAKVTNWGTEHVLDGPPRHTTYREGQLGVRP